MRTRFWVESLGCGVALLLAVLVVVRRDWIEAVLPFEPDAGSGELEWLLLVVALCATTLFAILARLEWRRTSAGTAR